LARNLVEGTNSLQLEISRPNYFFDNFLDQSKIEPVAVEMNLPADTKAFKLRCDRKIFPVPGYYQVRLSCLNSLGKPIGVSSDPVTINCVR
jgi:hypothetical protein